MKKLLSILGAISLVGTSTTSLISCNKHENTITGNLMKIWPEQGYFNKVDNKWYVVIVRGDSSGWHVIKFKNDGEETIDPLTKEKRKRKVIHVTNIYDILLIQDDKNLSDGLYISNDEGINNSSHMWGGYGNYEKYFKNVYQWIWPDEPSDDQLPKIDSDGNII